MRRVLVAGGRLGLNVYSAIEQTPAALALSEALDQRIGGDASRPKRSEHSLADAAELDVFGKTEAAGQRGVGEEGDLVDLAAAQGEHHHAPGLRAQVVAEGRLAVGARRA